jgi:hypothetical protein
MGRKLLRVMVVIGTVLALWAELAWAQPANEATPTGVTRQIRGQVGASVNNAGMQNTLDVSWTWPASRSTHPLLSGAHIATGITSAITPTQAKLGGWIEYSPLSILDLRAGFDPAMYFGTFDSLMGFLSYAEPFHPDYRHSRGGAKAGASTRTYLSPTLKFKAGPMVGSASADFEWWRSNAGEPFFYEPTRDTLLRSGGDQMLTTTSVLMYQRASGAGSFSIGGLHTLARVADAPENRIQKVGAIAIKEFAASHFGLSHPRLTFVLARYLEDPNKQDEWTAAIAIGFRTGR